MFLDSAALLSSSSQRRQIDPGQWGKGQDSSNSATEREVTLAAKPGLKSLNTGGEGSFHCCLCHTAVRERENYFFSADWTLCFLHSISCFSKLEKPVSSWKILNLFHKSKIPFSTFFHECCPSFSSKTWFLFLTVIFLFVLYIDLH